MESRLTTKVPPPRSLTTFCRSPSALQKKKEIISKSRGESWSGGCGGAYLGDLVQAVSDSGGRGLVHNTEDVQAGDDTGILGGLPLDVVEVGRDGNDGVGDLLAQVALGHLLHLAQDHGADLLGGELLGLTAELDPDGGLSAFVDNLEGHVLDIGLDLLLGELAADEAPARAWLSAPSSTRATRRRGERKRIGDSRLLDVKDCVPGVAGELVLGGVTDYPLLIG